MTKRDYAKEIERERQLYYRWTIKIPHQKWQALTPQQQAEVKKGARAVIWGGIGEGKEDEM